jgi:hypothetical protein
MESEHFKEHKITYNQRKFKHLQDESDVTLTSTATNVSIGAATPIIVGKCFYELSKRIDMQPGHIFRQAPCRSSSTEARCTGVRHSPLMQLFGDKRRFDGLAT